MAKKLNWEEQNKKDNANKKGVSSVTHELSPTGSHADQLRFAIPKHELQNMVASYKKEIQLDIYTLQTTKDKKPLLNSIFENLSFGLK